MAFENNRIKHTDRTILSVANISSSFWQYTVYSRGSPEKEASNDSGVACIAHVVLLHAHWHGLSLFCVCNKSSGSSDVGFGREGRNYYGDGK